MSEKDSHMPCTLKMLSIDRQVLSELHQTSLVALSTVRERDGKENFVMSKGDVMSSQGNEEWVATATAQAEARKLDGWFTTEPSQDGRKPRAGDLRKLWAHVSAIWLLAPSRARVALARARRHTGFFS